MKNIFDVYGPFHVDLIDGKCTARQKDFWIEVKNQDEGLATAIGCYMFCLKWGKHINPWYIGMTASRSGFKGEVFQSHKLGIYNDVLSERSGTACMFLFPMLTLEEQFSKAYSSPAMLDLERMLMGFAYRRNPDLSNVRDMNFLANTTIKGVFGDKVRGKPLSSRSEARSTLFGKRISN